MKKALSLALIIAICLLFVRCEKEEENKLPSPTNLVATYNYETNMVDLTWDVVEGVHNYYIYNAADKELVGTGSFLTQTESNSTSVDVKKNYTEGGEQIGFLVVSVSQSGLEGNISNIAYIYTPLDKPTGLDVNYDISKNIINLSWAEVRAANSYVIYRSVSDNSELEQLTTTENLTYTDQDVDLGNTYYYQVEAKQVEAKGKKSDVDSVRTFLAAPQNFKAFLKENYINLSWNSVLGATGYKILRAKKSDSTYTEIITHTSETTYNDLFLQGENHMQLGETYYYIIKPRRTSYVEEENCSNISEVYVVIMTNTRGEILLDNGLIFNKPAKIELADYKINDEYPDRYYYNRWDVFDNKDMFYSGEWRFPTKSDIESINFSDENLAIITEIFGASSYYYGSYEFTPGKGYAYFWIENCDAIQISPYGYEIMNWSNAANTWYLPLRCVKGSTN
jgi:fibronectin type 3 domain-containing protein